MQGTSQRQRQRLHDRCSTVYHYQNRIDGRQHVWAGSVPAAACAIHPHAHALLLADTQPGRSMGRSMANRHLLPGHHPAKHCAALLPPGDCSKPCSGCPRRACAYTSVRYPMGRGGSSRGRLRVHVTSEGSLRCNSGPVLHANISDVTSVYGYPASSHIHGQP
jgi:hypothetical protein